MDTISGAGANQPTADSANWRAEGIEEVPEPPGGTNRLYNDDLAPATERKWGTFSLFSMWMSDVHSIGGYTFAAGLFFLGLVGWQVLITLILGIFLVNIAVNMMGRAGQRMGTPFPVVSRLSFGIYGANIPALIRAIVAIALVRNSNLPGFGRRHRLDTCDIPRSKEHGERWVPRPRASRMDLLPGSLGTAAGRDAPRHGDDPQVPMGCRPRGLGGDGGSHDLGSRVRPRQCRSVGVLAASERRSGHSRVLAAVSLTVAYFSTLMLNFCDFRASPPTSELSVRATSGGSRSTSRPLPLSA